MDHTHRLTMGADTVRKRYVSWDRREADREWAGLTALARHAPGLAPRPLARETEDGAPVIVMSRLPGETLGREPLTATQTAALAAALRRLFAAPVDPGLDEREFGPSDIRSAVRELLDPEHDLRSCRDPALVTEAVRAAAACLACPDHRYDGVTDAVLALGDGNLANVWDGATCRLVDFEEFGMSDLTYEVADVTEHASSRLRRLLDVERLVDALGLTDDQRLRLRHHQRLLAVFWLWMLLPGNRGFSRNPADSTEDQARRVLDLLGD